MLNLLKTFQVLGGAQFLKVAESTDFHIPDNSEAETQFSEM